MSYDRYDLKADAQFLLFFVVIGLALGAGATCAWLLISAFVT